MDNGMSVYCPNFDDELLTHFIHNFYGYGNFHGNYWFIGRRKAGANHLRKLLKDY